MRWRLSNRFDPEACAIADRHYNRRKVGSPQCAPPGRCIVLTSGDPTKAFWISSAPMAQFVRHEWAGAWMCTAFRNEGAGLSSELILEAIAATRRIWGDPPPLGMVTFVDPRKVRKKRDFGRCYRKAGFKEVGATKGGLVALSLSPADFPEPVPPLPPRPGLRSKYAGELHSKQAVLA